LLYNKVYKRKDSKRSGCTKPSAVTDLRSSTYAMSPEKEKNS